MMRLSREEAIQYVLDGLQALILSAGSGAGREQAQPSRDPDSSDDLIADRKREIRVLRQMRQDFENVATGILSSEDVWVVEIVCGTQKDAAWCEQEVRKIVNLSHLTGTIRTRSK